MGGGFSSWFDGQSLEFRRWVEGSLDKYLPGASLSALSCLEEGLRRCDWRWIQMHRSALLQDDASCSIGEFEAVEAEELQVGDGDVGEKSLAEGQWAEVIFAGGTGTRFFSESGELKQVKGLSSLTAVMGRSFLDHFFAQALYAGIRSKCMPYLVLMTSSATDGPIRLWVHNLEKKGFRDVVHVVRQAEHPRLDEEGFLLIEPDGQLLWAGDGHGGIFAALLRRRNGQSLGSYLADRGVQHLVLHIVDFAASREFSPGRLGFHIRQQAAMTLSVVGRTHAKEQVGLVVRDPATGKMDVVEYSVCPGHIAQGANWAHINTNLVRLDAIRPDLPTTLYRGKRVQWDGRQVASSTLETLNQHLIRQLDQKNVHLLSLERPGFFLPTKRQRGEDSLDTTQKNMCAQDRNRIRQKGAVVSEDALVELEPSLSEDQLGPLTGWEIAQGCRLFLGVRRGLEERVVYGQGLRMHPHSQLLLEALSPYGDIHVCPQSRAVHVDEGQASRLSLGKNVVVEGKLHIVIHPGASLRIADHTVLSGSGRLVVHPKEHMHLSGNYHLKS